MAQATLDNNINVQRAVDTLAALPYKKGEYASRSWGHPFHFLVSYPSKLKPSIAHFLVQLFTSSGESVLDPFSGVGTIPFEACSLGRYGIGSDVNPLALFVTRAKIDPPAPTEVRDQLSVLEDYIGKNKPMGNEGCEEEIIDYYHPDTLKEILAAREFFLDNTDPKWSFLAACMSHILHGNRPYALSRRSHNIMPWPPKGEFVYKSVIASLREKATRMIGSDLPIGFVRGRAIQDDVRQLSLASGSVDCILTSPPFYANRDFLRMNRIRLWFCGWSYKKQAEMRAQFFENQRDIRAYSKVFDEFSRVLKGRRLCVMHLGVVKSFNMADNLSPIAKQAGFRTLKVINEDTSGMETHGIVDRGATHTHQFLVLQKE